MISTTGAPRAVRPTTWVSSICTTASAPCGTGPPAASCLTISLIVAEHAPHCVATALCMQNHRYITTRGARVPSGGFQSAFRLYTCPDVGDGAWLQRALLRARQRLEGDLILFWAVRHDHCVPILQSMRMM